MQHKNISFIERHLEKVVIAVAGVFTVAVVWYYCLGAPYTLEMPGSGDRVKPTQAQEKLLEHARQLESKIRPEAPRPFPQIEIPEYSQDFVNTRQRMLVQANRFGPLGSRGIAPADIIPGEGVVTPTYVLAQVPAPKGVQARADFAVLQPANEIAQSIIALEEPMYGIEQARFDAQRAVAEYEKIVPSRAGLPRDFHYVTVGAEFDLDQYYRQYQSIPELKRVPKPWMLSSMFITDVAIERQTLDPASGQWTDSRVIGLLPTVQNLSFRDRNNPQPPAHIVKEEDKNWWYQSLVEFVVAEQERITRHEFPPITEKRVFAPPDFNRDALDPEKQREWVKLTQNIQKIQKQIEQLGGADQPAAAPGRTPSEDMYGPYVADPRLMPRGAPDRATATQPRRPVRTADERADERRRQSVQKLMEKLHELTAKRDEIEGVKRTPADPATPDMPGMLDPMGRPIPYDARRSALADTSLSPYGPTEMYGPRQPAHPGYPGQPTTTPGPSRNPLLGGQAPATTPGGLVQEEEQPRFGTVKLMTHDLTVAPGMTYRYRVRVMVRNPLFRKQLDRAQKQLESQFSLEPEGEDAWSAWSDPVTVEPDHRFFVPRAAQRNRAVVEVWKIFDGEWRMQELEVGPGDPIGKKLDVAYGGRQVPLDMRTGAVAVDVNTDLAGARSLLATGNVKLYYIQDGENQLRWRIGEEDRNDRVRMRLLFELQQSSLASALP